MKHLLIVAFLTLFCEILYSQNLQNWTVDFFKQNSFIENRGQFDDRTWQKDVEIKYAIDNLSGFDIFFSKNGLSYRFDKMIKKHKTESDFESQRVNITELINVIWIDANKDVEIIAEERTENYFSYAIKKPFSNDVYNVNHINGYKRLTYKNLYDNVDVIYELFEKGLKYKVLVHPGADVSKIRMKYIMRNNQFEKEFIKNYLDEEGNFNIKTSLGEIKELKPYSFYRDSDVEVKSNFKLENDVLSFKINYDQTQELIIDPWVVSSNFSSSTAVWEVETDSVGNVYVIGGETPMRLQKFNSSGTLQWTYTTPWDTNSVWLGTLKTENNGTSYITSGSSPEIEKIDNAGGMVWHTNGSGSSDEYWSVTLNCDKSKLIVGGTILNMMVYYAYAAIFEIDINTGNVLSFQKLDSISLSGFGAYPIEVRSIASSNNGKHIFLTHKDVGVFNENISLCQNNLPVFKIDNDHHYGYKCENYLPATQNGGGIKAVIANNQFIYTHSGNQIHKRLLGNGALILSVNLSGGISTTVPLTGGIVVENCGLAVDNCGNVYSGSGDRVVKFDADLNFITEALLPFTVYDVSVNSNGEVIAVGAQGNNQLLNRNGRIQSIDFNACVQYNQVCCYNNICVLDTICTNEFPINLISYTTGGVWSGNGIIDSMAGTFDPTIAGLGIHTVYYTLPCGSDSVQIIVNPCVALLVCQESNGDITVSNGVGPYSWEYNVPTSNTPITNQAECEACGYTWYGFPLNQCDLSGIISCNVPSYWSDLDTGNTITPGMNYPIRVIDSIGNSLIINNTNSIPQCISTVKENTIEFNFKVVPNPSSEDFTVMFNNVHSEKVTLSLIDASGRVVFKTNTKEKEYVISGENLSIGIYLLKAESGKKIITEKLSKK